ncbi:hypothetical protein [Actinoplanes friuliensis]|uniref:Polycystic kidney disease protein 1-like 3 n=1 Tax=Actinoplanes friuliensis DSM 7358 TaxID=1246995 RepID=U5WFV0_9ACTN|nr:hypothetical protein [Actinoplanes friuliensis]AGZ46816.1 Polycystic kidney disease protein 1-like 3 [Actinoplanes friuliensis DSM 7358]
MQPIPEAVAWSLRADAWAQQNPETPSEQSGTLSRWSDVAATGRPALPAEGVGWRTQTSEWRSTTESARWRQTTEWRSASGTHGWRTTTEAWQAGDAAATPPQPELPTQLPAISGTAWPTPQTDDQTSSGTPTWQPADATPSWQQPPAETWQSGQPRATPPWESSRGEERPAWQQFTDPATPWQAADAPPPRPREPESSRPAWDTRPSWQQFAESPRTESATPSAPTSYSGSWSTPVDDGRHLVREDDRAAWRQSAAGQAGLSDGSPQVGRRRAPDVGSRTSGGTGWTVRSDADNWAGHTDTGSMPAFQDPAAVEPTWRRDTPEPPAGDGWRSSTTTSSWQSPPTTDSWRSGDEARRDQPRTDSWRTSSPPADGWRSGDEARGDSWRDSGSWRRDPEPGPPVDPWAQTASETGVIPLPLQPRERDAGSWQSRTDTGSWQRETGTPSGPPAGETGGRRSRSDTGSWQREPEVGGARQSRIDPPSWQTEQEPGRRSDTGSWQREPDGGARRDTGSWQRDAEPGRRTDTGSWQREPENGGLPDTGSWQRGANGGRPAIGSRPEIGGPPDAAARPEFGSRTETGSWQREPDGGARRDTGSWQRDAEPGRRTDTGSWQREPDNGAAPASWQRDAENGAGAAPWQRGSENGASSAPWQRDADGGAASWQRDAENGTRSGRRSDTGSWQREPEFRQPETFREPQRGGEIERWQGAPRDDEPRRGPEAFRGPEPRRGETDMPPRRGETDMPPRRGETDMPPRRGETDMPPRRKESDLPPRRGSEGMPRGPEPRRGVEGGQRSGGMPRGPEVQRGRPDSDRGPETGRDYGARRGQRDTSWQRELESGAWHRDPESDVWLRDSDTGQWHREELEDDEDEDDDRGPRRGPRGGGSGRRAAIESSEAVARRNGDESMRRGIDQPGDTGGGGGRRRAPEPGPARLQLTASAEPALDPEVWRLDGDAPTRPISPQPAARQREANMPISAQPSTWQPTADAPVSAQPAADWRRDTDRPVSAQPAADWRRDEVRPVSAQPGAWQRDDDRPVSAQPGFPQRNDDRPGYAERGAGQTGYVERDEDQRPVSAQPQTPTRPVSSQPGAWRAEAQAAERTDSWRNQLRAETGEPPLPAEAATTEIRQRIEPGAWREAEREEGAGGSATYREGNTGDWRRELQTGSDLADGESRRISTSDFVPFRPPSKNGAAASVKVPAANSASEGATEVIQRTGARWQDPPDTTWPPRGAVASSAGTYERRPVSTLPSPSARQNDLLEPDEDIEEDTGGPLAAVGYTVVWYGVPVVLFVLYMLVLNGAQQAHALSTLAGAAPQFGLSLVLSMLVAVGLRRASGAWKAASVGLAAAVMGGGLATVLTSAITGQSLS